MKIKIGVDNLNYQKFIFLFIKRWKDRNDNLNKNFSSSTSNQINSIEEIISDSSLSEISQNNSGAKLNIYNENNMIDTIDYFSKENKDSLVDYYENFYD